MQGGQWGKKSLDSGLTLPYILGASVIQTEIHQSSHEESHAGLLQKLSLHVNLQLVLIPLEDKRVRLSFSNMDVIHDTMNESRTQATKRRDVNSENKKKTSKTGITSANFQSPGTSPVSQDCWCLSGAKDRFGHKPLNPPLVTAHPMLHGHKQRSVGTSTTPLEGHRERTVFVTLRLLMCDRRMAVEYSPNSIELMAHFSQLEMLAKPKHPVNICDDSPNKLDKAEKRLIEKVGSNDIQRALSRITSTKQEVECQDSCPVASPV
ncbi:hypothetical protein WISP_81514 [Willisornis vidua]|uniref:Uncharacterized protein n=1 Tax=Willisornis vidua TaxID=1566151 RepID=A0ABQ9D4C8_9PASS|nr:hypothetical protein WISP_81514 [Willisornis vidua]